MATGVKKKSSTKKTVRTRSKRTYAVTQRKVDKMLVDNFVSMQKVLASLASKFDNLEKNVSSLLAVFEDSAKTIAEKEINLEIKGDEENQKEILGKLKEVLDQNKIIARGITLIHEANMNSNNLFNASGSSIASISSNSKENSFVPNVTLPPKLDTKNLQKPLNSKEAKAPLANSNEFKQSNRPSKSQEELKEDSSGESVEFSI